MRRQERGISDDDTINKIIEDSHIIRIGFADCGSVYIVPLNYGFTARDGRRIFYFHGAKAGRKYELLQTNPIVGFEIDNNYELVTSDTACGCTALYRSIIGTGRAGIVEDAGEKVFGLRKLMENATGTEDWLFSEASLKNVCVFRLIVEEISCKEHAEKA